MKKKKISDPAFVHREGFWKSTEEPGLPLPIAREKAWVGRKAFLIALGTVESSPRVVTNNYRGWSRCRCCEAHNGSAEYTVAYGGAIWRWPSGFQHYVEVHNVRPSVAFEEFIRTLNRTIQVESKLKGEKDKKPSKRPGK